MPRTHTGPSAEDRHFQAHNQSEVGLYGRGTFINAPNRVSPELSLAIRTAAAELEETGDVIRSQHDKHEVIGQFGTGYVLTIVFLAVVAGSAALTFWGFEILGNLVLRVVAAAALVGATVGSLELILAVQKKGSPLVLTLAITTFASCLVVHLFLSQARARMIAESVGSQSTAPVTIDGAPGEQVNPANRDSFSEDMLKILYQAVPMLSFALETAGGLILHSLLCIFFAPGAIAIRLERKLHRRLRWLLRRVERGPWWTRERILACLIPILAIALLLALAHPAFPAAIAGTEIDRFGFAIDLSLSRSAEDVNQDIASIGTALGQVPLNARIAVVGVTQDAFASPCVLLEARVAGDAGFMSRNLSRARLSLVEAWRKKSATLAPTYHGSDIAGSIIRLSRMLEITVEHPGLIVVLSDARQTKGVNVERLVQVPGEAVRLARENGLTANLGGSSIAMAGITTTGKSQCYFETLRSFWVSYNQLTHSKLVAFRIGRGPEVLSAYRMAPLVNAGGESANCAAADPAVLVRPATAQSVVAAIQLASPANHSMVHYEEQIEGLVRDPAARVVLIVRPKAGMQFWCAERVHVDPSGHFTGTAFFGRSPGLDAGASFQVAAIANTSACSAPGDVLSDWPEGVRSLVVEVTRH
jgi:hypothetical protein